jgi:hypothetical protein
MLGYPFVHNHILHCSPPKYVISKTDTKMLLSLKKDFRNTILIFIFAILLLYMTINLKATFIFLGSHSLLLESQVKNLKLISQVKQVLANHLLRRGERQTKLILFYCCFSLLLGDCWELKIGLPGLSFQNIV